MLTITHVASSYGTIKPFEKDVTSKDALASEWSVRSGYNILGFWIYSSTTTYIVTLLNGNKESDISQSTTYIQIDDLSRTNINRDLDITKASQNIYKTSLYFWDFGKEIKIGKESDNPDLIEPKWKEFVEESIRNFISQKQTPQRDSIRDITTNFEFKLVFPSVEGCSLPADIIDNVAPSPSAPFSKSRCSRVEIKYTLFRILDYIKSHKKILSYALISSMAIGHIAARIQMFYENNYR